MALISTEGTTAHWKRQFSSILTIISKSKYKRMETLMRWHAVDSCLAYSGLMANGVCQIFLKFAYWVIEFHGDNMGPIWVLSAPDGPHVGPMDRWSDYTSTADKSAWFHFASNIRQCHPSWQYKFAKHHATHLTLWRDSEFILQSTRDVTWVAGRLRSPANQLLIK